MRKLSFLALVLAMCLCLGACSSGEAPSVPEEPTTAVPEYSFINSDRYVQNGTTGIGYRVAIGDDATEEEMRAVFVELCSADSYDLHTVWFYGLPSDVEDVGSFSVGMLEEKSRGAEPVFTPCTYDADISAHLDTPRSFELLDRASGHRLGNIGSEVVDHKEALFREE